MIKTWRIIKKVLKKKEKAVIPETIISLPKYLLPTTYNYHVLTYSRKELEDYSQLSCCYASGKLAAVVTLERNEETKKN